MGLTRLVSEEIFENAKDLVIAITPNEQQNLHSLTVMRNGGTHKPLLSSGPVFLSREDAVERLEKILTHQVAEYCICDLNLDIKPGCMTRSFVTRIIDRLQKEDEVNTGSISELQ